jgi:hypothetical protein
LIIAGIGNFLWKNNQRLPLIDQVESHFESEIEVMNEIVSSINVEELYYRPHKALPKRRANKARQNFSESGIFSASIIFHHPGSHNRLFVVHDESLNLWSLNPTPSKKAASVTFCYSGLRQLIRYQRITSVDSNLTVGFEIVFPPEVLKENDSRRHSLSKNSF